MKKKLLTERFQELAGIKELSFNTMQPLNEYINWDRLKKDIKTLTSWFGTISGLLGIFGSDSRLKKNIKLVGKSPSGTNIYEFEYKNKARFGGGTYRGVLAQEVPKSAVIMEGGYRYVNYNKLDVDFVEVKPTSSRLLNNINNILQEQRMEKPNMGIDPMEPGREEMEMDPRGNGRGMENEKRSMALQAELSMLIPSLDEMVVDMTSTIPNDKEALAQTGWTQEYADMAVELSNIIKDAYNTMSSTGTISQTTYDTAVSFKKFKLPKWIKWLRSLFYMYVPE